MHIYVYMFNIYTHWSSKKPYLLGHETTGGHPFRCLKSPLLKLFWRQQQQEPEGWHTPQLYINYHPPWYTPLRFLLHMCPCPCPNKLSRAVPDFYSPMEGLGRWARPRQSRSGTVDEHVEGGSQGITEKTVGADLVGGSCGWKQPVSGRFWCFR